MKRARRRPSGYRAGLRFERSGFETWLESMCSVRGHSTLLYSQTRVAVEEEEEEEVEVEETCLGA